MAQPETCVLCGKPASAGDVGVWFVNSQRRLVHTACWIAAHERATGGATDGRVNCHRLVSPGRYRTSINECYTYRRTVELTSMRGKRP
jgi:hypothetical protein